MLDPSQYAYQYPNTTFDPNTQFSYFPPADLPPGVDPVAYPSPYPLTPLQRPFVHDPNAAASLGWLVPQADPPISYLQPPSMGAQNFVWAGDWNNQPNVFSGTSNAVENVCLPIEISGVGAQVMCATITIATSSSVVAGGELEAKRRKVAESGFVKTCKMCNVTARSPDVFRMHLAGKKHTAQANLIHRRAGLNSAPAIQSKSVGVSKKDPNKVKLVQPVWCEFCKIHCNSQDVYVKHLVGRKHQKNLDQLGKLKIPTTDVPSAARNPQIGPVEKVPQAKAPSKEDLETKKQKVIRGGAAAGEVRTCTVCNVVCNSQIAFSFHLSGQKHTAMVAKQALIAEHAAMVAKQALIAGSSV